jgi:hypothetical protein
MVKFDPYIIFDVKFERFSLVQSHRLAIVDKAESKSNKGGCTKCWFEYVSWHIFIEMDRIFTLTLKVRREAPFHSLCHSAVSTHLVQCPNILTGGRL